MTPKNAPRAVASKTVCLRRLREYRKMLKGETDVSKIPKIREEIDIWLEKLLEAK